MLLAAATLTAQPAPKPEDLGIHSKKALKYYEEGMLQAQYRDRDAAIRAFQAAIELEPDFAHAHYQLGINAYVQKQYDEALSHLEKAYQLRASDFPSIGFYLGQVYFYNERYADAIEPLQRFTEAQAGRKQDLQLAAGTLRHATFAATAIADSVDFRPVNLGPQINTNRDEYLPYLTADDGYLLFTARRPESVGGFNQQMQNYSEDFFFSEWGDTAWQAARNLGLPINTPDNEGAAAISPDGRTIFFTACNREDGFGGCDLYTAVREGDRWTRPQNMGSAINSAGWDGHPCLSGDGRTLYFASKRPGGLGGSDIWYARQVDGVWTSAAPLAAPINSPGNEDSPFLHADDLSLYFSSDYHPGFGNHDVFVAFLGEDGVWSQPRNLGYPLNTAANESHIFVNASGRVAYMNSDRPGGYGGSDIYRFDMDRRNRPRIATFLRGTVQDSITAKPLAALIRLIDVASGDTIRTATSARDGRFLMTLPLERQYAAFVEAPGYLFVSKAFFLQDLPEETYFDILIELPPLRKDVQVVLNNIFFDFGKYDLQVLSYAELDFVVSFLEKNPKIRIEIQGHTDDIGSAPDNLLLSQRRAEAVRAYLLQQGIAADRVEARGYGETMPVAGNITEEDRARNRRTEFKILDTGE
ncbi:MAG: OmpA family protein [Bacteroidia bacterium]